MPSAHLDTFARDHLPAADLLPEFLFDRPDLQFPAQLNCAAELLDRHVAEGRGDRLCLQAPGVRWTYADLQDRANRIARVLVEDLGLVPGNRVLLRAPNNPMLAACWFAVMKAGGIAVATMPLLRAKELKQIIHKARVTHALCDRRLADELSLAAAECPELREIRWFSDDSPAGLEAAMATKPASFVNVETAADDTCLLAFTSGTTGQPKATMHFHRDVMAACACWPTHVLRASPDDIFIGSPPLAFTFGLGGLLLFPLSIGASAVLIERAPPPELIEAVVAFDATILITAPTSYRAMATKGDAARATSLRKCVSAGEALPAATRALWKQTTGIEIIDGIGSTELLHIFISSDEHTARPGATGKVVPGYVACVMDDSDQPAPPGQIGRLAVKGPTGCRYLADERQAQYVKNGWNYTGDAYRLDEEGYFHYHSRTDDLIITSGYNVAAPEVEDALLQHASVAECAVIGVPDEERTQLIKAFVVLRPGFDPSPTLAKELQDFVKQTVAPYKYPRLVEFRAQLPRTETGKLQRFRLRDGASLTAGNTGYHADPSAPRVAPAARLCQRRRGARAAHLRRRHGRLGRRGPLRQRHPRRPGAPGPRQRRRRARRGRRPPRAHRPHDLVRHRQARIHRLAPRDRPGLPRADRQLPGRDDRRRGHRPDRGSSQGRDRGHRRPAGLNPHPGCSPCVTRGGTLGSPVERLPRGPGQ
jgi:2-aminobenzoate-CoA ligase